MRVISGKARGTKLSSIESKLTRPTLDRVKESLFNILQDRIKDVVILDLFAGSGALAIEALSRGASKAYLCDKSTECVQMIKQNLNKTRLIPNAIVIQEDYRICLKNIKEKIDIIFIDPPYKDDLGVDAIRIIVEEQILNTNGVIVLETDEVIRDKQELEKIKSINIVDERKYGRASLIFIELV